MNLEIVPFDKALITSFVYDGVEAPIVGEQILPLAEFYHKLGSVYLGLVDGRVVGLGGIYPLWPGSGGAFLFMNKEAASYKKSVFKILLEYINMLIKQYEIRTLMVECQSDSLEAHKLIEHLGFKKNKEIKMSYYVK